MGGFEQRASHTIPILLFHVIQYENQVLVTGARALSCPAHTRSRFVCADGRRTVDEQLHLWAVQLLLWPVGGTQTPTLTVISLKGKANHHYH